MAINDRVPADVSRPSYRPIDSAEIQGAARIRIDPDALSTHALERVVGKLIDAAGRVSRLELRQRLCERLDGPIEMLLLPEQLKIVPLTCSACSHACPAWVRARYPGKCNFRRTTRLQGPHHCSEVRCHRTGPRTCTARQTTSNLKALPCHARNT